MKSKIVIGTIYTLYGRRAGAELYFERILKELNDTAGEIFHFVVFCNDSAQKTLSGMGLINTTIVYEPWLDNQFKKAFWLEFLSKSVLLRHGIERFWISSGTNHFPGPWNIPTFVTFLDFGEYHVKAKYDFKRMIYRKMICIRNSIKRGYRFSSLSSFTADDLKNIWGKESTVIYSGPSPQQAVFEWKSKEECRSFLESELGIIIHDKMFLTPGRTDYVGKGLDTLFKAIHILRRRKNASDQFQYLLCGPQGEAHELLLAEIEKTEGSAIYLGRVDEKVLSALYISCHAVVFPSRFEGFGFPILEAYQNGKPIICSNGGAIPEVARDACLMFPVADSESLAKSIEEIVERPELVDVLVQKGGIRLKDFSWEKTGQEMICFLGQDLA